jgi:hypothetical protein
LEISAQETRKLIKKYCEMELRRPFTQDESNYKVLTEKLLEELIHSINGTQRRLPHSPGTPTPSRETLPQSNGGSGIVLPQRPFPLGGPTSPEGTVKKPDLSTPRNLQANGVEKSENMAAATDMDQFKPELRVVANTLTYFEYVWKRTFDIIPMFVENEFFIAFSNELRDTLAQELGLNAEGGDDKCNMYTAENPEDTIKREEIERKMKILVSATDILNQW